MECYSLVAKSVDLEPFKRIEKIQYYKEFFLDILQCVCLVVLTVRKKKQVFSFK